MIKQSGSYGGRTEIEEDYYAIRGAWIWRSENCVLSCGTIYIYRGQTDPTAVDRHVSVLSRETSIIAV